MSLQPAICVWLLIIGAVIATIVIGAVIDRLYLRRRLYPVAHLRHK